MALVKISPVLFIVVVVVVMRESIIASSYMPQKSSKVSLHAIATYSLKKEDCEKLN